MTQTAKHTPLPWVCNDECLIYGQVSSDDEPEAPFVADCAREGAAGKYTEQEQANAELIVRACNAHRDLIETLKDAATAMECTESSFMHREAEKVRAVIAKAEQQ
jgi:hypothetical protein